MTDVKRLSHMRVIWWCFVQVSKDGVTWTTLCTHVDDCSLNEPGSTHTWTIQPPPDEKVNDMSTALKITL